MGFFILFLLVFIWSAWGGLLSIGFSHLIHVTVFTTVVRFPMMPLLWDVPAQNFTQSFHLASLWICAKWRFRFLLLVHNRGSLSVWPSAVDANLPHSLAWRTFGDAFLLNTDVKSGCLSYWSHTVNLNQSGNSQVALIIKADLLLIGCFWEVYIFASFCINTTEDVVWKFQEVSEILKPYHLTPTTMARWKFAFAWIKSMIEKKKKNTS